MSLEADLVTALAAVCPRVYPDTAPDSPTTPYVVYQALGGGVINPLANVVAGKVNAFMQITVWSPRRDESLAVLRAIETALVQTSAFSARPQSAPRWSMDELVEVRGAAQDFSIWADR